MKILDMLLIKRWVTANNSDYKPVLLVQKSIKYLKYLHLSMLYEKTSFDYFIQIGMLLSSYMAPQSEFSCWC